MIVFNKKNSCKECIKPKRKEEILFVTSMSRDGYSKYGKRFIESWEKYCSPLALYVVCEWDSSEEFRQHKLIKAASNYYAYEIERVYKDFPRVEDFRYQPYKFAFKTSAIQSVIENAPLIEGKRLLVWLDADSKVKKKSFLECILKLVPEKTQIASFFDRNNSYGYGETGIVLFNLENSETKEFIYRWNKPFIDGSIKEFCEWHDAFYFSHLVRGYRTSAFKNLCSEHDLKSTHPINELTLLRHTFSHMKGRRKFIGYDFEEGSLIYRLALRFQNMFHYKK